MLFRITTRYEILIALAGLEQYQLRVPQPLPRHGNGQRTGVTFAALSLVSVAALHGEGIRPTAPATQNEEACHVYPLDRRSPTLISHQP